MKNIYDFATVLILNNNTSFSGLHEALDLLHGETDLFFYLPAELVQELGPDIAARYSGATVITRDDTQEPALLTLSRDRRLCAYNAVLNISPDAVDGADTQSPNQIALEMIAGSAETVQAVKTLYRTLPAVGMVGPAATARKAQPFMHGARPTLNTLFDQIGLRLDDWFFFFSPAFWIPGNMLKYIADHHDLLSEMPEADTPGQTGLDDHALHLLIAALATAMDRQPYGLERPDIDAEQMLVLPLSAHGPCNDLRLQIAAPDVILDRIAQAETNCDGITKSKRFDPEFYTERLGVQQVPGMSPLYHYALYGDLLGLNPGPDFSTDYYLITRQDVADQNICGLDHYRRVGIRQNVPGSPDDRDWIALAKTINLFSESWYAEQYPDVTLSGLSAIDHYLTVGRLLGRATHPDFDPRNIPALQDGGPEARSGIMAYLKSYYRTERAIYSALQRAYRNGDPHLIDIFDFRLKTRYGDTDPLCVLRATALTLDRDWDKAKTAWLELWQNRENGRTPDRIRQPLAQLSLPTTPKSDGITDCEQTDPGPAPQEVGATPPRVCVYTTLFGDIDDLLPILFPEDGIDYICFTDRERSTPGWRQVITDPGLATPNLCAKIFKVLPHRYLGDYTFSMFVDANTLFLGRLGEFVDVCRSGGDFVMWHHPYRQDLYLESCAIIAHGRHEPEAIIDQIRHYADQGLERDTGLFEASFMWRRHDAKPVRDLMEQWWQEIETHSSRDQLSLGYLAWRGPTRPVLMPNEIGSSRDNSYFSKIHHKPEGDDDPAALAAPGLVQTPRDITFLYSPNFKETGSTILRGQQLSDLVAEHYEDDRSVRYTDETDLQDQIIVLTKGFLKTTSPEQLHDLGKTNTLIADFVDEPPVQNLVDAVDVLMASSLCAFRDYHLKYQTLPCFHVTHHVDTRIPEHWKTSRSGFNAGYFGEMSNTLSDDRIGAMVAFNQVDTKRQSLDWMDQIGEYNFHYAFRKTRDIDGSKPFLKGFVASHCGANMLIQTTAGDAVYYLGRDYPYLLPKDATPDDIVEMLEFARDSYMGPEWKRGLAIMAEIREKSSVRHVLSEFSAMIDSL